MTIFKEPKDTCFFLKDEAADECREHIKDYCCVCCHFEPIENNDVFGFCLAPVPQWLGSNNKRTAVDALQEASLCDCFINVEMADGSRMRRYWERYLKLRDICE